MIYVDFGFEFEPLVVGVKVNYNMIDNEGEKLGYFNYVKEPQQKQRAGEDASCIPAGCSCSAAGPGWLAGLSSTVQVLSRIPH